jgi:hypothetical protein
MSQETFDALQNYVLNHRAPGSFLTALLSNDLMETVLRAGLDSRHSIPLIFEYIFHHCPGACWGSPEAVTRWISVPNANRQTLHLVS